MTQDYVGSGKSSPELVPHGESGVVDKRERPEGVWMLKNPISYGGGRLFYSKTQAHLELERLNRKLAGLGESARLYFQRVEDA